MCTRQQFVGQVIGLAALAFLLGPLSPGAQAGPILSDNFNSENGGFGQLNYFNFANWTVSNAAQGGTVDLIGNGFFDFYPGNGLYVDLDGSGNGVPGLLTTKQTFAPGTYTFSFDLAGSARGVNSDVVVNFGPFSHDFFLPSNQGYTLFTETVTLTAPAQLSFQNVQPGNVGAILDNVTVTAIPAPPVPEPSSLALLALGGLALAGWRRRKGKRLQA
jgi:PEP-CTERM motif